ncbi:type II toxin-antitoxin system RelE family toxin [Actinosynnema pretiosum]|uniref:Type II toxin-antitoxin system RelE/ParE family toxin n=1 Tax=Actinosynnema pretiosum TaxID=42197 RepID=A0A290Z762_9PSEU|nr:hypothetical protein [Actinosynnema pretiosum]ATE54824.1 hypothetical protein CNX65_17325 [Actinosynnema pretiosum]
MSKLSSPPPFRIAIAHEALRQFDMLSPRAARSANTLLRTAMRQNPEEQGVRLHGEKMKGYHLIRKSDFQITYSVDYGRRTVHVLRIESR